MEADFNYNTFTNRILAMNLEEPEIYHLPKKIKEKLVVKFLFVDVFTKFKGYFDAESMKNTELLYDFSLGFLSRIFIPRGLADDEMIIYDED